MRIVRYPAQKNFYLLFFFFTRRFYKHKKHKNVKQVNKNKKRQHFYAHKKHLRERKSLVCAFCVFYSLYAHKKTQKAQISDFFFSKKSFMSIKMLHFLFLFAFFDAFMLFMLVKHSCKKESVF